MNEVSCSRQRRQYWPAGEICILFEWDKLKLVFFQLTLKQQTYQAIRYENGAK